MPCHAMHPIHNLFLEGFSYVLQIDMHFICTLMWTQFYSCKKWVLHSPHPTMTRPSPHRCQTWHRSLGGRQAQAVPAPKAPTAAARGLQSSPPSPQAQQSMSHMCAQGGVSRGHRHSPPHECCRVAYECSSTHARNH
jgi:hypothetical protein